MVEKGWEGGEQKTEKIILKRDRCMSCVGFILGKVGVKNTEKRERRGLGIV